jgi:hypothetical protein
MDAGYNADPLLILLNHFGKKNPHLGPFMSQISIKAANSGWHAFSVNSVKPGYDYVEGFSKCIV